MAGTAPGRVVFLGSPSCVEVVLQRLVDSEEKGFKARSACLPVPRAGVCSGVKTAQESQEGCEQDSRP